MVEKVVESESRFAHFSRQFLGLLFFYSALGLFYQGQNVAHAEDPGSHAVGVEYVDGVKFFAGTDKFDRFTGHIAHRQRGAAARITVELRQNDTRNGKQIVERFGHIDRFLTDHSVDHQKNFRRFDSVLDLLQFFHQDFVDLQTAGRVDKDHIVAVFSGVRDAGFRNFDGRNTASHRKDGNADAFADDFQLINSGRTVNVARHEQGIFPFFLIISGEFSAMSGFAGALQTDHHDDRGRLRRDFQFCGLAAHNADQFFVYDLYNLLRRHETFGDRLTDSTFGNRFYKFPDDLEVNVGFKKCQFDFPHTAFDVGLGKFPFIAEKPESICQFFRQTLEHVRPPCNYSLERMISAQESASAARVSASLGEGSARRRSAAALSLSAASFNKR